MTPKTGRACGCKPGVMRDNCPNCEGTGQEIDFKAIRNANKYACGTRAVIQKGPRDFRVVCATCEGGGTVRYDTHAAALRVAVRDSNRPCTCGAR